MKEGTTNAESSCSRDRLCDDYSVEGGRARAIGKESCGFGEIRYTCNASVFLIQLCFDDSVFGGSDGGEDIRFALVVTVGADT